jgi:oxalate---CoA ligase
MITTHSQSPQIATLLAAQARQKPDWAAFIDGKTHQHLTWQTIAQHSDRLRGQLHSPVSGMRRVGLLIGNPLLFCRTYLAALAAGVCVAPLNPRSTGEELGDQIEALGLTDLIGDADTEELVDELDRPGPAIWQVDTDATTPKHPASRAGSVSYTAPHPAQILTTSGTSGSPKLVPLTETQLLTVAGQIARHHCLTPHDRGYSPLPLFHINAQVVGLLAALVSGASLVIDHRFKRERFWETAEALDVTWLNLVPAILSALVDEPPAYDPSGRIRFARSASSMLIESVQSRFESTCGIGVLETYGMTEAASQITANPLQQDKRRRGSVGLPVGVELRITDETDQTVLGPEALGMVEIRGSTIIDSYLCHGGRSDRIPARTAEGWLRTGDLGWRDSDGFLTLVGRDDDAINRGGEKLYPREIEEVLLRDRRVTAAAAVGRPHTTLGAQPVAFVTTSLRQDPGECDQLIEDLHKACASSLTRYKRPAEITVADVLPSSSTGKIARNVLANELAVGAR